MPSCRRTAPYYANRAELRAIDEGLAEEPLSAGAGTVSFGVAYGIGVAKRRSLHLAGIRAQMGPISS